MKRFTIGFKHLLNGKQYSNAYTDFKNYSTNQDLAYFDDAREVYEFCKELIHEEKEMGIYNEKNGYYTIIDHLDGTHIYHINAFKKEFNL